ncbi:MAG: sigma-54-dependent Fis family transcriptional regulator [Deltaproteobacteria bacterium]|nr:sigma-54-dependent Fis family transcriptional regulator [Deltaproteobacteria bacterium]
MKDTILIVDDRPNMIGLVKKVLQGEGRLVTAPSGRAAIDSLRAEPVDVVLCDLRLGDVDGLEVLRECKRLRPHAEFILMTAYASVDSAVEAMRLGAYDYVTKPFEPEHVRSVVLQALARVAANRVAEGTGDGMEVLPGLYAKAPSMVALAELVSKVAASTATVLLLGETGTGKERLARAVHALSPRRERRFIGINCAAIPADLLESELFGSSKGAFTGAMRDRAGLFEEADGGTLFLDEIGDMRLSLQAKLTRVLEERAIRRIGESRERKVDVRIVAATHRSIDRMVRTGAFREDLWYRLNVATVRIPPLRERPDDIELLTMHFLREVCAESVGRPLALSPAALEAICSYRWPGNVRQLRAAVERAAIVAGGERIEIGDLPPELVGAPGGEPADDLTGMAWAGALEKAKKRFGRRYLRSLLRQHEGEISEAAEAAGVERESFYRLLRRHDIDPSDYRE